MTLEGFIDQLNSIAFFKEFTFVKNTFQPLAGGSELELADNIVWMGDDLTVLQLKERSAQGTSDPDKESRWFEDKVLGKATKQMRDTMIYLGANSAIKLTNAHGHAFHLMRARAHDHKDYYCQPARQGRARDRQCNPNVNLVAITAVPFGTSHTQLTVFPDDTAKMQRAAQQASIPLDGPHPALVVQGNDEVGALARIHEKLRDANVHVFASTGVADGRGGYVYIMYIRPDEYELAVAALNV
jgi:hypothetical protein